MALDKTKTRPSAGGRRADEHHADQVETKRETGPATKGYGCLAAMYCTGGAPGFVFPDECFTGELAPPAVTELCHDPQVDARSDGDASGE